MILGDVVEVIGHGFAHVQAGVGLEVVEDFRGECRVGLDGFQAERPGQAWPAAFTGQASYVLVVIQ
ncbi:hypothetical protein D3C78_1449520 [compost metagenome]